MLSVPGQTAITNRDVDTVLDALCRYARGPVGVAVSGGSDSLALLYHADKWAKANGRELLCLTVDHGLRHEAAAEAAYVQQVAEQLNIPHRTLVWTPPDRHVSQARARRARHALLALALRRAGGTHLLLGHTQDDQIETAAIRLRSGSSPIGAASMRRLAVSPVWPEGRDVTLARPLLHKRRQALRELLIQDGMRWVEDPTNQNLAHERVRVRADLAVTPARRTDLLAKVELAAGSRSQQDGRLATWLDADVSCMPDGTIVCAVGNLVTDDLAEALALVLMAAGGTDRRAPLSARLALAQDILSGKWSARTLGGAWIAPRQGRVEIARDPGEAANQLPVSEAFSGVWDGRFHISSKGVDIPAERLCDLMPERSQARPMARRSLPIPLNSAQFALCLVRRRLNLTKCLLEEGTKTL